MGEKKVALKEARRIIKKYNIMGEKRKIAIQNISSIILKMFNRYHQEWSKGHRRLSIETGINIKRINKWLKIMTHQGTFSIEKEHRFNMELPTNRTARRYKMRENLWLELTLAQSPRTAKKLPNKTLFSDSKNDPMGVHHINTSNIFHYDDSPVERVSHR